MREELTIRNVPVSFPYQPYEVQVAYMDKVIEALQKKENALLESPTGTGKTLCLLCACLGWLQIEKSKYQAQMYLKMKTEQQEDLSQLKNVLEAASGSAWSSGFDVAAPPKIIYASRTHTQLNQAVEELKATNYRYMKAAVIGSRDQFCIHPKVSQETNNSVKVHMCRALVSSRQCYYYNCVDGKKSDIEVNEKILDIEDLVDLGRKKSFCPYYMSKELKQSADIIFTPYNYLIDPRTRKAHGIDLNNNIVIFDEAHNIEKVCEEAASYAIRSTDIALCIDEITTLLCSIQGEGEKPDSLDVSGTPADFDPKELAILKAMFLELEKALAEISLPPDGSGKTLPATYLFEFLGKAEISYEKRTLILELIDKILLYFNANTSTPWRKKGTGLQRFSELLTVAFSLDSTRSNLNKISDCYKIHIAEEEARKSNNMWTKTSSIKNGRVLNYWCFSSGFGMQELLVQNPRSIILTSGTLTPLDTFSKEMGISFPVQLENPHIIGNDQAWVGVITHGPDGTVLNSSYNSRNDIKYITSLGRTILNLSRIIPNGMLVFFPSYPIMKTCQSSWEENGIFGNLTSIKKVYVETQSKGGFQSSVDLYYESIQNDPNGCIFMAVCRGKVSEGLDFANKNGRAVVITGLPYPPLKDPRVILKKMYLDELKGSKKGLSGQLWYKLESSRAVNQAVGRVIRHKSDYGAIIFCDKRFGESHVMDGISNWLKPFFKVYSKFGLALRDITQFFKIADEKYPCGEQSHKISSVESAQKPLSSTLMSSGEGACGSFTVSGANSRKVRREAIKIQSVEDISSEYMGAEVTECPNKQFSSILDQLQAGVVSKKEEGVINFHEPRESPVCVIDKKAQMARIAACCKKRKINIISHHGQESKPLQPSERPFKLIGTTTKPDSVSERSAQPPIVPSTSSVDTFTEAELIEKVNAIDKKKFSLEYHGKVKNTMKNETHFYKKFVECVKKYREDDNINELTLTLHLMFSNYPEGNVLFREFGYLVKKKHIVAFNKSLLELTGQSI